MMNLCRILYLPHVGKCTIQHEELKEKRLQCPALFDHMANVQIRSETCQADQASTYLLEKHRDEQRVCENAEAVEISANRMGVFEAGRRTVLSPVRIHQKMATASNAAAIGWIYTIGFAALYSITALVLGLRGFKPYEKPLLPIPASDYYFAQCGFTLPVSIVTMGIGFGLAYGVFILLHANVCPANLWGSYSVAVVVPSFVFYWVPEMIHATFGSPGSIIISDAFNFYRAAVVAPLFIVGYTSAAFVGCCEPDLSWWKAILAALLSTSVTGISMALVFR